MPWSSFMVGLIIANHLCRTSEGQLPLIVKGILVQQINVDFGTTGQRVPFSSICKRNHSKRVCNTHFMDKVL
jgi:hypothetical protein